MIMAQDTTLLGQRAELIFNALSALGPGWHSRPEIAGQIGAKRLQLLDAAALDLLTMQGRIEAERHPINAPIRERWEYRIKE
jgi:hypothetical protein